jgi:hypothetical protein
MPAPGWVGMAAAGLFLCGCGDSVDNQQLFDAYHSAQPAEVTVRCNVSRLLSDGHGTDGTHQRFDIDCGQGLRVEIDHNVDLAPRVPAQVGSTVTIHGQFEPDPGHPVIHYTHHSTSSHHEGGYIELNGQTYS